mmetsp:Transcript_30010/g.48219  ORF Transcript_30010/g.48219 Transcript_30010/m.48219 type:complete len:84 (-) Transcript_30010:451-702(-)
MRRGYTRLPFFPVVLLELEPTRWFMFVCIFFWGGEATKQIQITATDLKRKSVHKDVGQANRSCPTQSPTNNVGKRGAKVGATL